MQCFIIYFIYLFTIFKVGTIDIVKKLIKTNYSGDYNVQFLHKNTAKNWKYKNKYLKHFYRYAMQDQ